MKHITVAFAFALSATGTAAQEFKLNIGTVLDPAHPVSVGVRRMAEAAEKQSGGRVKIEFFPSSQLGGQREMWQNVQAGIIAGLVDPTASLTAFVPQFAVLDLPYLVENRDQAYKMLEGAIVDAELTSKTPAAGFRIVHYWEITFRNVYSRTPVNTIADLKGKKIRVIPNPTFIALFRGLGAAPTPMAFGELYSALQQGVVDAAENDALTYFTTKHYEVAKNLALTRHLMLINLMVFSERQWQRLPQDMRKVVSSASLEGRKAMMDDRVKREEKVFQDLKGVGVNITEPDLKPLVDAGRKTWAEFEPKLGKDLIQKISRAASEAK
jgi:tripartite ATP-independent transporter DctP family solute receptor